MSTAANHRKRSHRSDNLKNDAFNASRHRALYRQAREQHNQNIFGRLANIFGRLANMFRRNATKAKKTGPVREAKS